MTKTLGAELLPHSQGAFQCKLIRGRADACESKIWTLEFGLLEFI
jgi:hypothetical protein